MALVQLRASPPAIRTGREQAGGKALRTAWYQPEAFRPGTLFDRRWRCGSVFHVRALPCARLNARHEGSRVGVSPGSPCPTVTWPHEKRMSAP